MYLRISTWENVSVVPLTWSKDSPVTESHWAEWAATRKQTPALWHTERNSEDLV